MIAGLAIAALILPFARTGKAAATSLPARAEKALPRVAKLSPYFFPEEKDDCIWPQGDLIQDFTGEDVDFFVTDIRLSKNQKEVLVTAYPMIAWVLTEEQVDYLRNGGTLTIRTSTDTNGLSGESVNWENRVFDSAYKFGAETEKAVYLVPNGDPASDACIWPSEDEAFIRTTHDYAAFQLRKVADGYLLRGCDNGYWDKIWRPAEAPVPGSPCLLRMPLDLPIEYSTMDQGILAKDCVDHNCFCAESVCWMEWSHMVQMSVTKGMVSSVYCSVTADGDFTSPVLLVQGFPANASASEDARRAARQLSPYACKSDHCFYRPCDGGAELTWLDYWSFQEGGDGQIPRELDGMPVRSVYSKVLYWATVQTLVIPDTVERISAYAFTDLQVSCIEIQNPCAYINENAFYYEGGMPDSLIIRGYKNSTAEAFAKKHPCRFEAIDHAPKQITPAPAAQKATD